MKYGPGLPSAPAERKIDFTQKFVNAGRYPDEVARVAPDADDRPDYADILRPDQPVRGDQPDRDDDTADPGRDTPAPGLKEVNHASTGLSPAVRSFLRIFGVAVAGASAVVSGVNSYEWFAALRSPVIALLMSISIVSAGILLPDFAFALARTRRKATGAVLLLAGIVAIAFCMVTTTAALYNTRTLRTEAQYATEKAVAEHARVVSDARSEKARIEKELLAVAGMVDSTQGKIDQIPVESTLDPSSQALVGRLNRYLALKKGYEIRLDALNAVISDKTLAIGGRADFYSFLAGVFNGDSANIEFLTQAVPAVFIEIIAPIMMGVALFL